MTDKAVITCSLTGVLTDPLTHPVPVSVAELTDSAKSAYDAGASCMHIHFRQQEKGKGHLPSWDPKLASDIADSIRAACPQVIINFTTGTITRDQQGPINCILAGKPEIAACNAGSLNYLKVRSNGNWAWPPLLFENPVEKVEEVLAAMNKVGTRPEFECFDIGIVRAVGMYKEVGMVDTLDYNLVMGVDSGMPCDAELLPIVLKYLKPARSWQTTLIGRQEIWPVHQKTAELGGHLRTGLEDTFYLPDGERASSNAALIEALVKVAENVGRTIASPAEARELFI
jgi:uncharacterized protein (DUF849 family)